MKAAGRAGEAVQLWKELWMNNRESPVAADALYLAAETLEETGDFVGAEEAFRKLLEDYPSHRLAPRARRRLDQLEQGRRTGDAPLREYQEILNRYFQMDPFEAIRRMESVVERYPDFTLRPKALLWVADRYMERGRFEEAVKGFDLYLKNDPRGEAVLDALEGKGSALSRQHRYAEAAAVFESMKGLGPAGAGRAEGLLHRSRAHQVRRNVFFLGFLPYQVITLAALAIFLPWRSVTKGHVTGALKEIVFVAPLLLALYLLLARRNPFTARGILVMLAAVPPVLFLNSLYVQSGPMPRVLRWVYPAIGSCFVAGIIYGIFYGFDLVFVLEQIWGGEVEWQ